MSTSMSSLTVRSLRLALPAAALAALAACGTQPNYSNQGAAYPAGTVYQQGSAATVGGVEYGRVTNVEFVRAPEQGRTGPAGAIIGGVAGAVIGHQIGAGTGRDLATIAGGVGGAVAGNAIQKNAGTPQGRDVYRVSVQVDNGTYRAYDLGGAVDLRAGDRVRIENGQLYRM